MKWITLLGCLTLSFSTLTTHADHILRIIYFPNLTEESQPYDFNKLAQDPAVTRIFYPELTVISGKETSIKDGRTIQIPTDYDKDGKVTKTEPKFCGQEIRATLKETPTPRNFELTFDLSTVTDAGFQEVAATNGTKIQQPTFLTKRINTTCFLREGMWLPLGLSAGPEKGFYAIQLLKK